MSLLGVGELLPEHIWVPTNVKVTVMRARGLRAKGKGGTSDAYTIIQLGRVKFSTLVAEKTTGSPEWKEECSFELSPGALEFGGEGGDLVLTVMHRALIGLDKFLGQIIIHLGHVFQDKRSQSSEWYKLYSKPGKKEKERGEIQVMIQFTRNNMTASMFDLSVKDKPRSTFGKLKDKMKGKKKYDMESASAIIPSSIGKLDSDDDDEKDDKKSKSKGFFLKAKLRRSSLTKSNTSLTSDNTVSSVGGVASNQVGLLDALAEDSAISCGNTSSLAKDIPVSNDQSSAKGKAHKRAFSDDASSASKVTELSESQNLRPKNSPVSKSSLCVNGSHVYSDDKQAVSSGLYQKSSPQSSLQILNKNLEAPSLVVITSEDTGKQKWTSSGSGEQSQKGHKCVPPTITVEDDIISPNPALNQTSTPLKKAEHFIEIKPMQVAAPVLSSETREAYHEEHRKEEKPKLNLFYHGSGKSDLVKNTSSIPEKHHVQSVGSSSEAEEKNKVSSWFSSKDTKDKPVQKPSLHCEHPGAEKETENPAAAASASLVLDQRSLLDEVPKAFSTPPGATETCFQRPLAELKQESNHLDYSFDAFAASRLKSLSAHKSLASAAPAFIISKEAASNFVDLHRLEGYTETSSATIADPQIGGRERHVKSTSCSSNVDKYSSQQPGLGITDGQVRKESLPDNVLQATVNKMYALSSNEQIKKESMPDDVLPMTINKVQVVASSDAKMPLDNIGVPFTLLSQDLSDKDSDLSQELAVLERCEQKIITANSTELNCNTPTVMKKKTDRFCSVLKASQELATTEMSESSSKITPETDSMHTNISTCIVSDMKTSGVEMALDSNLSFLPSRQADKNSAHHPRSNSLLPNTADVSSSKLPVLFPSQAKIEAAVSVSSNTFSQEECCMTSKDFKDAEYVEKQTVPQGLESGTTELPPPKPPRSFTSEYLFDEDLENGLDKDTNESCDGESPAKNRGKGVETEKNDNSITVQTKESVLLTLDNKQITEEKVSDFILTGTSFTKHVYAITEKNSLINEVTAETDQFKTCPSELFLSSSHLSSREDSSSKLDVVQPVLTSNIITAAPSEQADRVNSCGVSEVPLGDSDLFKQMDVEEEKKVTSQETVFVEPDQSKKTGQLFETAVSEHSVNPCAVPNQETGTVLCTNSLEKDNSILVNTADKDSVLPFSKTNSASRGKIETERWPHLTSTRVSEDKCTVYSELAENASGPEESVRSQEARLVKLPLQNLSQQPTWLADDATNFRKDKLWKVHPDFRQSPTVSDHSAGNPFIQPGSNNSPFVESFSSHSNLSEYQPLDRSLQEDSFKYLHLKATPQSLQSTGLPWDHVRPAFNDSKPLAFSTPCLTAATNSKLTILPSPTLYPTTFGQPSVTTQAETLFSFPAPQSSDVKASLSAVLPRERSPTEKLLLHSRTSPHPVKPLSSAIQNNSSDKKLSRSSLNGGTEKPKPASTGSMQPVQPSQQGQIKQHGTKGTAVLDHAAKYYHLTHDELIQMLLQSEEELENKRTRIHDLEDYIDILLVRIMEQTPSILQVGSEPSTKKMP